MLKASVTLFTSCTSMLPATCICWMLDLLLLLLLDCRPSPTPCSCVRYVSGLKGYGERRES